MVVGEERVGWGSEHGGMRGGGGEGGGIIDLIFIMSAQDLIMN